MDALCTEVRRLGERLGRLTLDTVFIGGGTPSLVDPALLAELVATVQATFSVATERRGHDGGEPVEHHCRPGPGLEGGRGQPHQHRRAEPRGRRAPLPRPGARRRPRDRRRRRGPRGGLHLDQLRPHLRRPWARRRALAANARARRGRRSHARLLLRAHRRARHAAAHQRPARARDPGRRRSLDAPAPHRRRVPRGAPATRSTR